MRGGVAARARPHDTRSRGTYGGKKVVLARWSGAFCAKMSHFALHGTDHGLRAGGDTVTGGDFGALIAP